MRYAIVGAGSRHAMYREALAEHPVAPGLELVALCDVNAPRLRLSASHLAAETGRGVGRYDAVEFVEVHKATSKPATKVVFERDGDDFPKRVMYWRDGDALMARIEGTMRGQARAREWRYERAK
mgnify:CR=1 FL=1